MSDLRRYEILLPSQFNDGTAIPQELIAETLLELEDTFGARVVRNPVYAI
jgi:hypothetical protein